MDLKEIKKKIEIRSANPEENERIKGWLMEDEDCFGRGYYEGGKYCRECTVMAHLDDRYEQLKVFCQESTPKPETVAEGGSEEPKGTKPRKFRRL